MTLNTFIPLVLLFATTAVNAIVIRHDVDDKNYLALGEQYSPSVAYVAGCAATVINNNWLLTAAHCVAGKESYTFTARHINSQYRVAKIVIHPKFKRANDEFYDAALVQLKDPLKNAKPAALNQQKNEVGQQVIFVGRGTFGNGQDGLIRDDTKQRGATNTVASANEHVIGFTFNKPETATQFEGISSRGDSGGPAFVIVDNTPIVIGISSYQVGNGIAEGRYGVSEYYTRVSSIYPWLQGIIESTATALVPNHPLIDAVKNNELSALNKTITESTLNQHAVITEAFYQSVILNRVQMAKTLIDHGAKFENVVINKDSLFVFALINNKHDYFRMLQNTTSNKTQLHNSNSTVLPLFISSFRKDPYLLEGAKLLIQQGANLNAQTKAGDTALILAGWSTNNFELVKLLVANGADLNIANNNGDTPIIDAAYLGKIENLRYLLKNGADKSRKNKHGNTALDVAENKNNELAIALLSAKLPKQ